MPEYGQGPLNSKSRHLKLFEKLSKPYDAPCNVIFERSCFAAGSERVRRRLGRTLWVSWVQYFLIIVMASATASVIGADEIVGRINTVVAIVNESGFLIAAYGFVAAWFILFGLLFKFLTGLVGKMVLSAGKPAGLQAQE